MKKTFAWLLIALLLSPVSALAEATLESVLGGLETTEMETWFNDATDGRETFSDTVLKLARGEIVLSADQLLKTIADSLLNVLASTVRRLPSLLVPCVLCGAARFLRGGGKGQAVGEIVYVACFLIVAGLMVKDLSDYMALTRKTVGNMAKAMQALFPLLLTLLAAVGASAASFFGPAVVASSGTMTAVIEQVTLRCALIAALMSIISNLSENMRISRLTNLFRQLTNWTLGVCFTVFIGVTALQGMGVSAADGVTLRTAKYAVDNFVPVVGGMFADTMDTLVGCSLLIKNALGLTGLLVLLSVSLSPIVQAAAGVMLYRASAALLEPVGDERLVKCMQDFSDALMLLLVVMLSVCLMFILLTAQLLAVGNATVSFR